MFTTREVLTKLLALPWFRSEFKLGNLFHGFRASFGGVVSWIYVKFFVQAGLVDGQGLILRPFVHWHDLSSFSCYGMRHDRLPDGKIRCYFQAFCITLSHLLLVSLDSYDLPCHCRKFHCQIGRGDYGSKLVECLLVDWGKIWCVCVNQ